MGRKKTGIREIPAKRLQQLLEEQKLTQTALAKMINCSPQQINQIIMGRKNLSATMAEEIAKQFVLDPELKAQGYPDELWSMYTSGWLLGFSECTNRMDDWKGSMKYMRTKFEKDFEFLQLIAMRNGYELIADEPGRINPFLGGGHPSNPGSGRTLPMHPLWLLGRCLCRGSTAA